MTPVFAPRGRSLFAAAVSALAVSMLASGCSCSPTPMGTGVPDPEKVTCTDCHGDPATRNPAPPRDLEGGTDATLVTVGAHTQHLSDSAIRKAVGCAECHRVPARFDEPGHNVGRPAKIVWGDLADQNGKLSPAWDRDAHTCSSTYCHGKTLTGGTIITPDWIKLDGTQAACGTCHGNPPPAPHPQDASCSKCHSKTVKADGTIDVAGEKHVNGTLEVDNLTCTSCHGTEGRSSDPTLSAAPPKGTRGETLTTQAAVGAHQKHLSDSAIRTAIACSDCHSVPADFAHANGQQPKFVWSSLATHSGALSPASNADHTCSSTWCHGASLKGGTNKTPNWTLVDNTQAACGTCHGNPPPAPHPQNSNCNLCHPGTVLANGSIDVAGGKHIDGTIDAPNLTCTSCHGTDGRAAVAGVPDGAQIPLYPPASALGSAFTAGAHEAHTNQLGGSQVRNPLACSECHLVPGPTDFGHATGTVNMTFGTLAQTGGATASYTASTATAAASCANYCHGTWTGTYSAYGKAATIAWNASATTCSSCHDVPLALPHPPNSGCDTCHGAGYSPTAITGAALGTHVDGTPNLLTSGCTSCHGDLTLANAPNTDVRAAPGADANAVGAHGEPATATTQRAIGAHAKHLTSTTYRSAAIACSECHSVPAAGDKSHANGTAAVAFGTLAKTNWAGQPTIAPGYAGGSCSATYCHGAFKNGAAAAPSWTAPGTVDCTSCHGTAGVTPLPGGNHPVDNACGNCHDAAYTWNGTSKVGTVNGTQHLNGVLDLPNASCTTCHGQQGRASLVSTADVNQASAPPVDHAGSSNSVLVGAHLEHVNPAATGTHAPYACSECHLNQVPTMATIAGAPHMNGSPDVRLGTLASTGGVTPSWQAGPTSCASTYCHGNFNYSGITGNAANTVTWNQGGAGGACGSCHGNAGTGDPTPTGHKSIGAAQSCGDCHPGYTRNSVDPTLHVNGQRDGGGEPGTPGTSCGACHLDILTAMTTTTPAAGSTRHTLAGGDAIGYGAGTWSSQTTLTQAGGLYDSASCLTMCHGDHPHTISGVTTHQNNVFADANVRSATADGATRAATDFANSGTGGLCLSCHTKDVDAARPKLTGVAAFGASAHNKTTTTPGGAWTYTLHDGSTFARNCTKCHADPADKAPASSTINAVHSSAMGSLLTGATRPNGTAATFVCYGCHGNGTTGSDYSGKNIASLMQKPFGHDVLSDNAHATVTENGAAWGTSLGGGARHVNCLDCHDPHEATATKHATPGNLAGGPLKGVNGVPLSATAIPFWTAPVANNFAAQKPIDPATDLEASVCLKCHSSYYWGATVPTATYTTGTITLTAASNVITGTGTSWNSSYVGWMIKHNTQNIWYVVTGVNSATSLTVSRNVTAAAAGAYTMQLNRTDVAKEFNPANVGNYRTTGSASWEPGNAASNPVRAADTAGSFHPIFATAGNNLGAINLNNLVTTNFNWSKTARNLMTCSDCHESDQVTDPSGPHGSAAPFLLRGGVNNNTRWDNSLAATSTGMPTGTFCANCHDPAMGNSRYGSNDGHTQRSAHRVACMNCHSANVHGGPRPGFLNPIAGKDSTAVGSFTDYDATFPYDQHGSGSRLYLFSYPANNTTTWDNDQNNCGCNGTNH